MTTARIGENISREWQEERQGPELWDALQHAKTGQPSGVCALEEMANGGSALAMMYLGNIYMKGKHGLREDHALGEHWLRRSAEAGSIEGRFGLAHHFLKQERHADALAEYRRLGELGYSPALFILGLLYWNGAIVEKDVQRASRNFEKAAAKGHIYAAVMNCYIAIRHGEGLWSRLRGIVRWGKLLKTGWALKLSYPSSDRLRRA